MHCDLSNFESHLNFDDLEEETPFEELNEEEKKAKCYKELEEAKLRRQIELLTFIEDFTLSEEFEEYLNKLDCKEEKGVQCDEVEENLVEEARNVANVIIKKKTLVVKDIIRKKQEETINKIRDIIHAQRVKYECNVRQREYQRLQERKNIFSKLKTDYGIDLNYTDYKSKIIDKVILMRKSSVLNKRAQEERKLNIIKKILHEYKRDFQIQQMLNKSYDYKVISKPIKKDVQQSEDIIEDLQKFEEVPTDKAIDAEVNIESKLEEAVELDKVEVKEKKGKKKKSGKKSKKDKKSKKSNKTSVKTKSKAKKKKDKKSKSKKSLNKEITALILPLIPNVNPRKKILADKVTCETIIAGINYIKSLAKIAEDFEKEKNKPEDVLFDEDKRFVCRPKKEMIIKNFENGHKYLRHLEITNAAYKMKKCRFVRVHYITEEDDVDIVQVNCPGVLLLAPGISAKVSITFCPLISKETIQGKLLFITYEPHGNLFGQVTVPFVFCVQEANIMFKPTTVKFAAVPIWHVERKNIYETVKFINTGKDLARICIRKVPDQTEHEDTSLSLTSLTNLDIMRAYPESCLENVFSYFCLQSYVFEITPGQEVEFKIQFKTAEHIGFYVETYQVFIYKRTPNNNLVLNSIQDLFLTASTTGFSINIEQTDLDFQTCALNSIYQQTFTLQNMTRNTLRSVLKFPSSLKDYFIYQKSEILIQGFQQETVSLKFLPRENLLQDYCEYFDKETGVLEFPLRVETIVSDSIKQPAIKLIIYAILVQPLGIFLRPKENFLLETEYNNELSKDIGRCILNLGECSTKEFISSRIEIKNNSNCLQHFGFLHLSKHFIMAPNYGFGVLNPYQSKTLTIFFVPERRHVFDIKDKLVVNTIKNLGKMKKTLNPAKIAKKLKNLERNLLPTYNEKLMTEMMFQCVEMIKQKPIYLAIETFHDNGPSSRTVIEKQVDVIEVFTGMTDYSLLEGEDANDNSKESTLESIKNLVEDEKLAVVGNILDVLLDFSAQSVSKMLLQMGLSHVPHRFKDTPCGTISIATLYLYACPSYIDFDRCIQQKIKNYDYAACFQITGDNPELLIEPTCGILKVGEKIKIYLVAKPQLKDDDVVTEARNIKIQELTKLKRAEIKLQMEKERLAKLAKEAKKKVKKGKKKDKKKKSKKDKKVKGKKSKKSKSSKSSVEKTPTKEISVEEIKEEDIIVEIKDEDICLTYFDYYPAEMCLWRNMKPYFIEGNFVCTINYLDNIELQDKQDILQLKAVCKVIRPEITHNLTTQDFDFGSTVIGTKLTKSLEIQNITYNKIFLNISRTNPLGPYKLPDFTNLEIPAEYITKLPVIFNPTLEEECLEYIEITTTNTRIPIILKGSGVIPDITFFPTFTIVRLDCPNKNFIESPLQISNNSKVEISLRFEKVCELVGYIRPAPIIEEVETNKSLNKKGKKGKKGSKSSKSSKNSKSNKSSKSSKGSKKSKKASKKGKKRKVAKLPKYSEEFTDIEEYSMENNFEKLQSSRFFNITTGSSNIPNRIIIPANTKPVIKIQFGVLPEEKSKEEVKTDKKTKKGKGKNKGSKKSKSSKASKGSKKSKKNKASKKSDKSSKVSEKMLKKEMTKTCIPPEPNTMCYICKYNVLLGETKFFKDIIIIGYFK